MTTFQPHHNNGALIGGIIGGVLGFLLLLCLLLFLLWLCCYSRHACCPRKKQQQQRQRTHSSTSTSSQTLETKSSSLVVFHHDHTSGHEIPIKYDKSSQFVNQFEEYNQHVRLDERTATIRSTVPDLYYLTVPKTTADSIATTDTNSNNEFNIQYDLYDVCPSQNVSSMSCSRHQQEQMQRREYYVQNYQQQQENQQHQCSVHHFI